MEDLQTQRRLGWSCQESQPYLTVIPHSLFPDDVPAGAAGVPHGEVRSEPGSWYLQAELELFVCHAEVCSSNILLLPGMLLGSARDYVSRLALTYLVLGLAASAKELDYACESSHTAFTVNVQHHSSREV